MTTGTVELTAIDLAIGPATDRSDPAHPAEPGARLTRRLSGQLADTAQAYARAHGVPFAAVAHAAVVTVLHRYSGQSDLVYGCGDTVVRVDLSGDPSFADVVLRCHIADAGTPLRVRLARRAPGGQGRDEIPCLAITVGPSELTAQCPADLFDADRVDRLIGHITAALAGGLAAPDGAVADIDIVPPAERQLVLRTWNPRPTARTPGVLHQVTAGRDPHRVAIRHQGVELTYGELERRSNQLANALREHGIGAGHVVGLLLDRGFHLPVAQIAVMKAGGAWLPLDPEHPAARLGFLAADADASLVLTTAGLDELAAAAAPDRPRWRLDDADHQARVQSCADTAPEVEVHPDDPAYLLYTSGSTGTPKGVLVPHRSAYSYCQTAVELFRTSPADRVAQASNPAFDASIFDCYATLLAGATLISAPRETIADTAAFTDLIHSERVTLSYIPPAVLAILDPDELARSALRGIFSAGEALPPEQAGRWSRSGLELHNSYGPTETTVVVTDYLCTDEPLAGPTPIGAALPDHRAYALDERLRPTPIGVLGQLYIAGTGVAYGYHNQPGLTAERFLADPYAERPGERMYATGDLVRWRADGVLEFFGRRDRQVQIRGQRVELGEIEHTLTRHPDVRQCAVLLRESAHLVAYLTGEPDLDQLREYLADQLPTYMIPTTLVTLPALPLTPNGKLDTSRLPVPARPAAEYVEPRTPTQRWLAETWQEILGVDRVGAGDSFFDLGGNSLHVTQLVARARDHLHAHLSARDVFTSQTLGQLASRIDEADGAGGGPAGEPAPVLDDEIAELERLLAEKRAAKARLAASRQLEPVPRDGALVCTHQQEGLWFEHQLDPASTVYHIPFALRLRGPLDVPALGRALHALVVRHESLRTRFVEEGGLPRQVIDPPPALLPPPVADLTGADAADVQAWVAAQVDQPMDLAAGPLLRTPLARLAGGEHVLVLVVHHIVADGWSARILAGELTQLYAAETGTGRAQLPELRVQPADHAAWQRSWLDGAELERQVGFWRETLADLPTVDFPTDRPRPANPTGAGASEWRRLPDGLATAAREYARAHRVSFLAVTQAALLTVLHRYTGQTDLPIGSIFSGRTRADTEPMVGYFVNALVLRTRLDGNPSFAELIDRCHETVLAATSHQDVPFGLVVDALRPERIPGRNPLFQINLSLQPPGAALGDLTLDAVTAEPMPVAGGYARFDIAISVFDSPDGRLELAVEYSTELFDADRIERLLDHVTAALAAGLAAPSNPVAGIDILSAAERHQVLRAWNDTAVEYPAGTLHRMVEAAAAATPDAIAVIDHDGARRTYRELDAAANRLAHRLRRHGVGPDVPVGVCLQRGADLVTALLATWKAGGAYVPLDPELPPERLAFMLADAAPPVVLTHAMNARAFPVAIALDAERDALAAEPSTAPDGGAGPDDTAYVLYTSGSTGVPKGVKVAHRGVHNRIAWMQDAYRLEPADRVLQKTPYGFDVSVWEFFWPLTTGATLVLAAPGGHRDPAYLHELIVAEGVTTLHFVPTMLHAFLDAAAGRGPLGRVRRVFCSGEALPPDTARRFLAAWPGVDLHNLYGPTEASIDVTAWRCVPDAAAVPIGRPIANTRTYVVDERLRPVPIGVPGQLMVAGAGLAHGYLNQPALTAQKFLPDLHGEPGHRMYATGDLARWRSDGVLEFLGRIDRQVKLRGQRIELGEIEHAVLEHPQVRRCAVVLRDDTALVAYLVGDADPAEVRRFLADRLPGYLIPSALVRLAELPTTPNGKLDTARLPDPTPPPEVDYVPPSTDTERWLAILWQHLLRVDRVGAEDTFFGLGANSLHLTQLGGRIRDQFGIHLHPRHLFANPTLRQLAARLDEMSLEAVTRPDPLMPLRRSGTRPPLFLVHPLGGAVTHYLQLAEALGEDQPVYAIEDPELYGIPPAAGLVGRAIRYIELIRQAQPHGPYHLGGWSLGGPIALEMAQQLADLGESVAVVISLDSRLPELDRPPTDLEMLTEFVVHFAETHSVPLPEVDLNALQGLDRSTLEDLVMDFLTRAGVAQPDLHAFLRTRMRVFAQNIQDFAGYQAREYGGRLVLISARDNDAGTTELPQWLASPHVEHVTVPGDHLSMMHPPHVTELAAAVRRCIDQAASQRL